jgi:hypothetical protein
VRHPPKRGESLTVRERRRPHPSAMLRRIKFTIGSTVPERAPRGPEGILHAPPASLPACRTRRRSV